MYPASRLSPFLASSVWRSVSPVEARGERREMAMHRRERREIREWSNACTHSDARELAREAVWSESLQLTECVCTVCIAAERSAERCTTMYTQLISNTLPFAMDALCTLFVNTEHVSSK